MRTNNSAHQNSTSANVMLVLRAAIIALTIAVLVPFFAPRVLTQTRVNQNSSASPNKEAALLEIGAGSKLAQPPKLSRQFKVVSYNIRWRSGDDLRELIKLFQSDPEIGGAAFLGLQETDRRKKRSSYTNTPKLIANELGMHYAWAAPPTAKPDDEEETGAAVLSVFPLSDVRRIVLPHPGPGKRRRVALGATLKMGTTNVRIYSVHSESRMAVDKKLEQMKAVLDDLKTFPENMPAIILGDLNTWQPAAVKKTFKLFQQAGFQTPFDKDATFWRRLLFFDFKLKLDWIWLRGLSAVSSGIDREIRISDHWPLWAIVRIDESKRVSTITP
jgi:endonuclease/exonuclease/phosphatase family metal-dependent hydrolase